MRMHVLVAIMLHAERVTDTVTMHSCAVNNVPTWRDVWLFVHCMRQCSDVVLCLAIVLHAETSARTARPKVRIMPCCLCSLELRCSQYGQALALQVGGGGLHACGITNR